MPVRTEVANLVALGPLPESSAATEHDLEMRVALLNVIKPPLNQEEAAVLLGSFGPDDCFGVAWTLVHLLETTPGGAVLERPRDDANEWVRRVWARAHRED